MILSRNLLLCRVVAVSHVCNLWKHAAMRYAGNLSHFPPRYTLISSTGYELCECAALQDIESCASAEGLWLWSQWCKGIRGWDGGCKVALGLELVSEFWALRSMLGADLRPVRVLIGLSSGRPSLCHARQERAYVTVLKTRLKGLVAISAGTCCGLVWCSSKLLR